MINIIKSQPAPLCLSKEKEKQSGDYKCGDVLKRLKDDFHNKCYICEEKELSTLNVEHFRPHKGNKDLKFDWNNLFLSCGHCNNLKSDKYDNILNCTDNSRIIVDLLKFEIGGFPKSKVQVTALTPDPEVASTAELLNKIYNGTTKLKIIESENITQKAMKEVNSLTEILLEYYKGKRENKNVDIGWEKIKLKLSMNSPFTAFKIWVIKNEPIYFEEFKKLIQSSFSE